MDPLAGVNPDAAALPAWALDAPDVARHLGVDPDRGLDAAEAGRRLAEAGRNELRRTATRSVLAIGVDQFRSLIVLLLAAAAGVSFAFGETVEGLAIAVVIALNGAIGFVTEWRAVRSMESLRGLSQRSTAVLRGGRAVRVPAAEVVPGDVVLLEAGDVVTADLRVVEASRLAADEAALTGESVPVGKSTGPVAADAPVVGRRSLIFKGTAIARGSGRGVVIGTGMHTELGRIASLIEEAEPEVTPLERRLEQLGRRLIGATLAVAALVGAVGLARGQDVLLSIETAIALAVAAVPEGLPIVATLALARGLWRMARRNAVVERLSAVETLGSTSVILADKTGTLTEGRMSVAELCLPAGRMDVGASLPRADGGAPGRALREALRVAALCNDASFDPERGGGVGDPTETALLALAARFGLHRPALLADAPELREEPFDTDTKMMATFHREGGDVRLAVKGAPEAVLAVCRGVRGADAEGEDPLDDAVRERWLAESSAMAERGLRVLALATRTVASDDVPPYADLVLLGLVGLLDPPRAGVREAVAACRGAGIRVVMVTGDHAATARAIAAAVGIADGPAERVTVVPGERLERLADLPEEEAASIAAASVVARATPAQKLGLIALHQRRGEIVAMTGDGVNDAPALKKADIGVAMGHRGTQVAKEAAALVLRDDELRTIVAAVEQGRVIFGNIRKFAVYLLSCNVSEVMVVGLAALAGAPLPLLPLQILFLNLVTDVFPALALGASEGEGHVMERPPRPSHEPILGRFQWWTIGAYGLGITVAVLGAFALALGPVALPPTQAVTVSFVTLAAAQLVHVLNLRDRGVPIHANEITRNPWMGAAMVLCGLLVLAAVYVPSLAETIGTGRIPGTGWALVGAGSVFPVVWAQAWRRLVPAPAPSRVPGHSSVTVSRNSGTRAW